MGLAAPRKRTKISHDPNNTNWTRSTSGFGHKILSSQGWTPGSFLGARNATHADMFTAASASHIRVIVKDDTLGLGARSKRDPLDEPTGLDAFKGLLGRLNGKSDAELQIEQKKRDDVKLARYAATKWQAVRFISGGLLAQEKEEKTISAKANNPPADAKETLHRTSEVEMNVTDKYCRRDVSDDKTETTEASEDSESHNRRDKDKTNRDSKKDKERKKKKGKKDKKDRKVVKEKEKKRKRAEQQEVSDNSLQGQTAKNGTHSSNEQDQLQPNTVKERRPPGRHMIRGRYIAQKRKAVMDEKSLNEIFMVKS
ncbi:hypothetical protein BDW74DRAFT_143335 [Aspergillus multicolor]|uniref:telomerase inhibitor/ribosome biogenesis protein PXR1 n=1 Tax=Aspergillus multicolor TaxID=41759 RepID=UPI003CCC9FFE